MAHIDSVVIKNSFTLRFGKYEFAVMNNELNEQPIAFFKINETVNCVCINYSSCVFFQVLELSLIRIISFQIMLGKSPHRIKLLIYSAVNLI